MVTAAEILAMSPRAAETALSQLSNDEVCELARTVDTPGLAKVRAGIPRMNTSTPIGMIEGTRAAFGRIVELIDDDRLLVVIAVAMAMADEIDRRIPPREVP